MDMDHDACYRVLLARDSRFDGRLFVGVKTTGIYCRPICPARTPKQVNVNFYGSAAAAQEAGFRPCLRCRPELSPDLASRNGSSSTVSRALRLIANGALEDADVETLANRLGVGARQLRRLFARHLGASPIAVAQTQRVHLAKQLIHDTQMSMVDVALASGFGSVRRFNEAFKDLFGRHPASLRRQRRGPRPEYERDAIDVRLSYSPPYDWDEMLSFLSARAIPGVERVVGDAYVRSIEVAAECGLVSVRPSAHGELTARIHFSKLSALPAIIARLRRVFDLAADPTTINAHLARDRLLRPLIAARPGLRVAGAWDGFELAVRAILGQQISVVAARQLAGKLVSRFGQPLPVEFAAICADVTHVFPAPAQLMNADIITLGMPGKRGMALNSLARAVVDEPGILGQRNTLEEAVQALRVLPGIGEWTAQYIAMREMREPDAFPAADVALIRAMQAVCGRRFSPDDFLLRAENWRPWRAYAAAHLWASLNAQSKLRVRDVSAAA
jgi:AraC family transcriptional regulator of adaptative response / DNA-3-methyladenine glycosylase II